MSTSYSWEGLKQLCASATATLLGAHHVPECPCGGIVYYRGTITKKCSPLPLKSSCTTVHSFAVLQGE